MVNGAASLVYLAMFLLVIIPVGIYCHWREQRDTDQDNH